MLLSSALVLCLLTAHEAKVLSEFAFTLMRRTLLNSKLS